MKIALIVTLFPPKGIGGTEIAAYHIAKGLTKRGHSINVITSSDKDEFLHWEGFSLYGIKIYKHVSFIGSLVFCLKTVFVLIKLNPDIIQVQSIGSGIPAYLAWKLKKKPYIIWGRGSDVYLEWRFKNIISKAILSNASALLALTEDMKKKMSIYSNKQISVIPNGLNLENYACLPSKWTVRRKFGISRDSNVIIFVGTLRAVKGVEYLIHAFNIVRTKTPNPYLMIVGDGKERQHLEYLVKNLNLENNVRFMGKVPNEEIPNYMVASDIFVLPSLSESFGIVNLEAMACGLPIIASKIGGIPEVVQEGINGFLVEPRNSEKLAEKIIWIFENPKIREKISDNNKKNVQKYDWTNLIIQLENISQRALLNLGSDFIELEV